MTCLWPDCDADARTGSELCHVHRAHVDECMGRLATAMAETGVRGREARHGSAFIEHTERPRPPT